MNNQSLKLTRILTGIALASLLGACGGDSSSLNATASEDSSSLERGSENVFLGDDSQTAAPETSNVIESEFLSANLPHHGMVLHLESDQGVTDSQGIVTHWWDQSGQDNSLTSVGGPQIVENVLNRNPVITFNGTDSRLERTADVNLPENNSDRSVVLLINYAGSSAGGLNYGAAECNRAFQFGVNASGIAAVKDACLENTAATEHAITSGEWVIQTAVLKDSELRQYVDGVLINTSTQTFNTVADQLVLGGALDNSRFDQFQIAAAFVWNKAITSEEMLNAEGYLTEKYLTTPGPQLTEENSENTPRPVAPQPVDNATPEDSTTSPLVPEPRTDDLEPVVDAMPEESTTSPLVPVRGTDDLPVAEAPAEAPADTPALPDPDSVVVADPAPAEPAPAEPTVTITSSNIIDGGVELNWQATDVEDCTARGPWANTSIGTSGSQEIPQARLGDTFVISCSNSAGTAIAMVTVTNRTIRVTWNENSLSEVSASANILSYGTSSGNYSESAEIPASEDNHVITVGPGPLYIAMRSRAADGTVSEFSNELVIDVD